MPTIQMNEKEIQAFVTIYKALLMPVPNEYMSYFMRGDGFSVSIYKSGKVVFQGSKLSYFSDYLKKDDDDSPEYPYDFMNTIGSDEVGTGDVFGPIVVATAFVKGKDTTKLKAMGVKDSKKIVDSEILKIADELIKRINYKVIIVRDEKFNSSSSEYNLNEMKARLHNHNFLLLSKEVHYDMACLDQFCSKTNYYKYLEGVETFTDISFEMKGETKSIAVAAASIIARAYFLKEMDRLYDLYGYRLPKGSGKDADLMIKKIRDDGKEEIFNHIAKLSYKNFKK